MPRLTVRHLAETTECSHCGMDMPEVTSVFLDGEHFLTFDQHSQCDGDNQWHEAAILHAILTKLGYSFEFGGE